MGAKSVQISPDDGTTWYTLPGNSGEFNSEAGELEDTIYGQNYKSSEIGLINWSVQSNALYKGFAGYIVDIKKSGTSTTFTTEAFTLVSGKTYQINDAVKQIWDRTATFTVYDDGVDQNSNVESIDYLFGRVTFKAAYTVTGPVTVTGKYLPMAIVASYRSFTLSMTMDPIDNTDIPTAQANGGNMTFTAEGLKTVSLELSGVYASSNGYREALAARSELVLEINPDGTSKSVARGFFKSVSTGQSGDIGSLEEEQVSFRLQVPDSPTNLQYPFRWNHSATTTLNQSVREVINAWQDGTVIDMKYLHDGTNGVKGDVVVADCTLSGGLEAMNEFAITLQGSGALTVVP